MNLLLPDVTSAYQRLKQMPGVTKVVIGAVGNSPHSHKVGDLKFVRRDGSSKSVNVRVYSSKGMQNLHVYGDLDAIERQLTSVPKLVKANGASPLPADSRIELRKREQPVYPTVPAPMLAADAVKDSSVTAKLVWIDPATAANWLERNTRNRRLRSGDVAKYAADMKAGRWLPGGSVIKFDINGTIVNGQHVLWAILESGVTVQNMVITGVDPNVVLVEDDHARRKLEDVFRINTPGTNVNTHHTAVSSMLRMSMEWAKGQVQCTHPGWTRQEAIAFLEEHMESIEFADSCFRSKSGRRGIAIAPVMTPLARAWHTENREMLARFAVVVLSGLVQDTSENSAILLRNFLTAAVGSASGISASKQDAYRRTERALKAFLEKEALRVLKPYGEELFPLPGERKRKK